MFGPKKKQGAKEEIPLPTAKPMPAAKPQASPAAAPAPVEKPVTVEKSATAAAPAKAESQRKLTVKVADLDFEIARQPGSNNLRLFHEDGREYPVNDVNTVLLWEILKAVSK